MLRNVDSSDARSARIVGHGPLLSSVGQMVVVRRCASTGRLYQAGKVRYHVGRPARNRSRLEGGTASPGVVKPVSGGQCPAPRVALPPVLDAFFLLIAFLGAGRVDVDRLDSRTGRWVRGWRVEMSVGGSSPGRGRVTVLRHDPRTGRWGVVCHLVHCRAAQAG